MRSLRVTTALIALSACVSLSHAQSTAPLRFEVVLPTQLKAPFTRGRMFVVLGKRADPEPWHHIGDTGVDAAPLFACDVDALAVGAPIVLDAHSQRFPLPQFDDLKPGDYFVQAAFRCNPDLRVLDAPGNLFSEPRKVHVDPSSHDVIQIELTRAEPPESLPADTDMVKFVKIESPLLSRFWGRTMFLRAGVIVPKGFDSEPDRRYPLRVQIGGYGQRFRSAKRLFESPMSGLKDAWLADDAPRMVLVLLDGAGPLGDPYQVNSENHGPYGDAITQELIPFVEKRFRCIGEPRARFLTGASTGGWVSFALQVFYPDFFNGCWSKAPDGVDFRAFQLIDVYKDENAYVNAFGFERPAKRTVDGEVEYTIRHECEMENTLGDGDSWTLSGGQWGAWNATYGPRGADGRPMPLWDAHTGAMHRDVVEHWKQYDLRIILEKNWATLGPKLAGKIHIMVGDADDYFLNNAVVRLQRFLDKADPPYAGSIQYGWRQGHGFSPISELELMRQMVERSTASVAK